MATPEPNGPTICRLLAIETSGRAGSVALAELDNQPNKEGKLSGKSSAVILASQQLPPVERSTKTLAPAISELLATVNWKPTDLTAIAVTDGPGSFTGLRVGVTTAKTMAYALGTQVIGISPLAALAQASQPIKETRGRLWTLLDAQRQEWFAALFDADSPINNGDRPETLRLHESELFARLQPGDTVISPTATSLAKYAKEDLADELFTQIHWQDSYPTAEAVAHLGMQRLQAGQTDNVFQLAPKYHRVCAAEENYDAQQKRRPKS